MGDLTDITQADQPQLTWRDGGVPVSVRFDDPYFSLAGGLAETRHVFLQGNDLPARLRPGFHVAELGFGTGLNCLALAAVAEMPVIMTSFEAFPMDPAQLAQAHEAFPQLAPLATQLQQGWGGSVIQVGQVELHLQIGDVRQTLPAWDGRADAWFLDGFSPAKNPEMWAPEVMAQVGAHSAPQATFATYTAAGHVRRALADAGFQVERRPGFGSKRHMSVGRFEPLGSPSA
ncbi:tRNA (5-methylaminomethyl-2-thiouridine)(34)-methyltransferase MnmD [Paracoccus seriniphilus]|uniref:tRNA U34 5-methylaminomethyl-2-thiouridine-forming methyltransferase MnmC n=1 Tax=Paracoccus seriniphilus TaxID=184748 RepID=A0A239PMQ5_9RHOB|nr:tRNA (5-methylaminomethyl-2-thiouridine)(34)-methyltransferase MnmD [Paracoccus seriniphilus]WCR13736.1 tRNA (5-methylaminomethyl-2-thiouridine)(34)-methyltransferase MnmD [Paracoccus seriniphilus]SNT68659.1 tRNA U34 5-methylaminomethyl-2-thiouridine-forming methyltransferase MnmC [Paracoccus seriniphilus]